MAMVSLSTGRGEFGKSGSRDAALGDKTHGNTNGETSLAGSGGLNLGKSGVGIGKSAPMKFMGDVGGKLNMKSNANAGGISSSAKVGGLGAGSTPFAKKTLVSPKGPSQFKSGTMNVKRGGK